MLAEKTRNLEVHQWVAVGIGTEEEAAEREGVLPGARAALGEASAWEDVPCVITEWIGRMAEDPSRYSRGDWEKFAWENTNSFLACNILLRHGFGIDLCVAKAGERRQKKVPEREQIGGM